MIIHAIFDYPIVVIMMSEGMDTKDNVLARDEAFVLALFVLSGLAFRVAGIWAVILLRRARAEQIGG